MKQHIRRQVCLLVCLFVFPLVSYKIRGCKGVRDMFFIVEGKEREGGPVLVETVVFENQVERTTLLFHARPGVEFVGVRKISDREALRYQRAKKDAGGGGEASGQGRQRR